VECFENFGEANAPWLRAWVDIKISGKTLRKGFQNIAIAKGRCGIKWIRHLNLFHISIYELNSRA